MKMFYGIENVITMIPKRTTTTTMFVAIGNPFPGPKKTVSVADDTALVLL